jgi:hypothetical protein
LAQAADQVSDREWQAFRRKQAGVDYVFYTDGKITGKTCVSLMAQ